MDRKILAPTAKGSVFEEGRVSVTEPFTLKVKCFRARSLFGDVSGFQESHVNSPERRKAAKPTVSAALRLMPSKSVGMRAMMRQRMSC